MSSSIFEIVNPGRMNELVLVDVDVDCSSDFKVVSFTYMLDNDMRDLLQVSLDIDRRFWWVYIENGHFDKIPVNSTTDYINSCEALRILRIVLVEFQPKTRNGILALKKWRNKLQVWPAKLLHLNK